MSSAPNVSDVSGVTPDGAAWLASASGAVRSFGCERPDAPVVLPCGVVFDVVSVPAIFGRRMLDRLWKEGPGSGPVAEYRGRMLLFGAVGTAQRLPALLRWEEWGAHGSRTDGVPPLLCHGAGDAVTVPAPSGPARSDTGSPARWLVAPDSRSPWLPGPEVLLWAAVRAARTAVRISIFPPADRGANVYDVSRRR
ncbi:hypothetical protein OIE78_21720 [Streptomyces cellulosae]|jgi:hypothetical protein|uniref:DNA primase/polymerase bifunctional N-terminal domain-containing protein n=1 Tax=Streptomyces thermocarboxydus TaxID=59299 RepID=A0ABU3J9V4_9ACTN|nr:hypothetical protein [Streptomyces thermocarboxydus]MXQ57469.1 hypothetical protein [Streptomyces sp. XHT-2]MYQ32959.1 hypothetical protein [Streptomyces sp. SID4956]MYW54976.1 hypothetical protein [Streptomyces sp. SID8376]WSB41608.1 hypothetical protein OG853_12380 [Streptomyces cellulosae]